MYVIIFFFISSYSIGKGILSWTTIRCTSKLDRNILSIALGVACWCFLLFFLGHLRLLHKWVLGSITLITSLPAMVAFCSSISTFRWNLTFRSQSLFDKSITLLVSLILIMTFVSCFAPVTGGIRNDEIGIHLSVPKDWQSAGAITMLPYQVSHLAGHCELLFLFARSFAPGYGPKVVSWIFMVLCSLLVYAYVLEKKDHHTALLASCIILMNPLIFRTSFTGFIDLPTAFFILLALRMLFCYKDVPHKIFLIFASFFMGTGCGFKPTVYFYIPSFIILLGSITLCCHRYTFWQMGKRLLFSMSFMALFASPWPIRNVILTKSPTFPPLLLLYSFNNYEPLYFSEKPFTYDQAKEFSEYYPSRVKPYGVGIGNYFLFPWNITMHPESFSIGDSIGTIMLSFLPIAFFFFYRCRWFWLLMVYGGVATTILYFGIIPEARYLIPVYMVFSIVVSGVIVNLERFKLTHFMVQSIVFINLLFSLALCVRLCYTKIQTVFNSNYRREYKKKHIPYYEAFEYCHLNNLNPLVVLYGSQVFYYLHQNYCIDNTVYENPQKRRGYYVLDIDYSQTLERNLDKREGDYALPKNILHFKPVFKGPDAVIYVIE